MPPSKTPAMKTPVLSTVYLDNERIGLMGDPRPIVAKIVAAGGKRPDAVLVVRSRAPADAGGSPVGLQDVIDRTAEPAKAIYLTTRPNAGVATPPAGRYVAWPLTDGAPRLRGPLPAGTAPTPARPGTPPDDEGRSDGEPEWRT